MNKPEKLRLKKIQRFRNSCIAVRTYPGADILSDHVPLVVTFKIMILQNEKDNPK